MKVLYFGKWSPESHEGHDLRTPNGYGDSESYRRLRTIVGGGIDASWRLLPGHFCWVAGEYEKPPTSGQTQGEMRHTVWMDDEIPVSCLATWDRTADHRGNSTSQFWVWGTDDATVAEQASRTAFPWQWARLDAAGTPESRRRPDVDVLAAAGLSPRVAGSLADGALKEVADLIRRMKEPG